MEAESPAEQGMGRRELAKVLCRLLALCFAYMTVAAVLDYQAMQGQERVAPPTTGPILVAGVTTVVLGLGAGLFARMMVSAGPLPSWPRDLTPRVLLTMGLMLLGLAWMLLGGLKLLTWVTLNVTHVYGGERSMQLATKYVGEDERGLFGSLLIFIVGMYLVFGARGVVRVLGKVRDGLLWLRGGTEETG